jgi:hypothetical protein
MGTDREGNAGRASLDDYRAAAYADMRAPLDAGAAGPDEEVFWTAGVATDVQATWRRYGWTPPSELPEYQAKWDFFKTLRTRIR